MKKIMACLLAFLMVLTVAPISVFADGDSEFISNINISNANLDLKAGHVPDVTGTIDKALSGKVELVGHGWVYTPEEAPETTVSDNEDEYEPPFYYWFNSDKYNQMYPQKNLKKIVAGQTYQYMLSFRIADTTNYDFSDDITVTINGKTYNKHNASVIIHRYVYVSENTDPHNPPDISTMKPSHVLQVMISVTAAKRADGWQKSGGKWYYIKSNKEFTGWQQVKGVWYYLTPSMAIGWKKVGGKWYYFNTSGAMQTGWHKLGGKWYYFNTSGAMQTGWQKVSGKWYYFNSAGDMKTGWLKSGGKWYYLDSSGAMVAGKSIKIGGKTYKFNADGVCVNP